METANNNAALATFAVYLGAVLLIAWWAHRASGHGKFVSEYFLGNRTLGMWGLALTFAATAASGGTFVGFPAKIYTHGWVLGLWIASYMVVPIMGIALLGKRINQVARRSKAVTIPELIEERFGDARVGIIATLLVVFFMFFYLLAQFKAGSNILTTLLSDSRVFQGSVAGLAGLTSGVPWLRDAEPAYLLCLLVFAVAVIVYVVYGGFRAVVWTDVMQGFVMFAGVVVMLVLVLNQVGGLGRATRELAKMTPPMLGAGVVSVGADYKRGNDADAVVQIPEDSWLQTTDAKLVKLSQSVLIPRGKKESEVVDVLMLSSSPGPNAPQDPSPGTGGLTVRLTSLEAAGFGADTPGVYVSAPGPSHTSSLGFLTLGSAISFFIFWAFGTAGQPSNMVRLMAFKDTRTLRRSVVTVSVYFSVIYFSLVVIFCCGRVLLPGWDDDSDRIMPELASHLTAAAGAPWLAGLLLAAPFAAVMSSVDSFLLMVSSSLVRDVYQRRINPGAPEKKVRRLAHTVTAVTGAAAVLAVVNPPAQLQDLIVYASGGLGGSFLVPVALALYWPRCNGPGMIAGLVGGFVVHTSLAVVGFYQTGDLRPVALWEIHSFVWALLGSLLGTVVFSLTTPPPGDTIVRRFFR